MLDVSVELVVEQQDVSRKWVTETTQAASATQATALVNLVAPVAAAVDSSMIGTVIAALTGLRSGPRRCTLLQYCKKNFWRKAAGRSDDFSSVLVAFLPTADSIGL